MKRVLLLFLCLMISFGHAMIENYAMEEKSRPYEQAIQWLKYPYIEPKCCNFSTTPSCSRMGSDGFMGYCMPRNETCIGQEYFGNRYCVISKHQSCKCCVPTDCSRQTLSPCSTLNGTCIGLNDYCNGTSVVSEDFCRKDGKKDTCKCCLPPDDCPCGQNEDGICLGTYPRGHEGDGKRAKGRCKKSCRTGHTSLIDHTCNKTGGKDCKCCDLNDYCGETCKSRPFYGCQCMVRGAQCPKGYCVHPGDNMCPDGMCSCCSVKPLDCASSRGQCSGRNDYCVEKISGDCPKGYAKLYNGCYKKAISITGIPIITKPDKQKVDIKDPIAKGCDCCKSSGCSSIGDRCSGRGDFCLKYGNKCPKGYAASLDCSRPLIFNGTVIGEAKCICCKPLPANCPDGCFLVGSQCFRRHPESIAGWEDAAKICDKYNYSRLAEPEDPQALSQYLTTNYEDTDSYWIGARSTTNGNPTWISGGVIGPDAPWFSEWCGTASSVEIARPGKFCVYLQANSGCYVSNQCLGCSKACNPNPDFYWRVKRNPLCSCGKPLN